MGDSYLKFANTQLGTKLTSMLGLPRPLHLKRHELNADVIDGNVVLGAAGAGRLLAALGDKLHAMGVTASSYPTALLSFSVLQATDQSAGNTKALIYDASELSDLESTAGLYDFFHAQVRSVRPNGRVIVFARSPQTCTNPEMAVVQRALEGLVRSLAKELRQAITVQLVYVDVGGEANIESTLRFLLSTKSAYVSAQVIRVSAGDFLGEVADWAVPLLGRKVLVTGASRGIGLSIAEVMCRDGAQVTCLDIPSAKLELNRLSERLNTKQITLDVSVENAPEELAQAACMDGGWDVIVHNAGITRDKTLARMTSQQWAQVVDINLSAQQRINTALMAAGAINSGGTIISLASISGIAGNRGQTNYAFSKAGVIGMVQAYAPILEKQNITINAVAPGFIETDMTASMPLAVREAGRRLNSLSQGGLPVDVAETVAWLANPSAALNGNIIRVCGQSLLGA